MKQAVQKEILIKEATRLTHPYGRQQADELSAEEREQLILDHLPQVRMISANSEMIEDRRRRMEEDQ